MRGQVHVRVCVFVCDADHLNTILFSDHVTLLLRSFSQGGVLCYPLTLKQEDAFKGQARLYLFMHNCNY